MKTRTSIALLAFLAISLATIAGNKKGKLQNQQKKTTLKIKGFVTLDGEEVKDATVTLFSGGTELETVTTKKSGKFKMSLQPDHNYTVMVSHPASISKSIDISTVATTQVPKLPVYSFRVKLLEKEKLAGLDDLSFFDQPAAKISYNEKRHRMERDNDYSKMIKLETRKLIKQAKSKDSTAQN